MEKAKSDESKFSFTAVFIIGLLGVWMTARYYLRKESPDERQERGRRIAVEMNRFHR